MEGENLKVEPRSTFTFTRGLSYIASILFMPVDARSHEKITRQWTSTSRLRSFQKVQVKSISIFFKFVHVCLLLYLLC